jgi:pimeloyl-ACP methyl ester carboxylesterase
MRRSDEGDGPGAPQARLAVHRHNLALAMFGDPARIDETAVRLQAANVERARFRRPPGQAQDLLLGLLPTLALPVLGVWGGRDSFDADVGVRVAALLAAAPAATTAVIAGAGHWVGYEAAAEVNRAVLQWMHGVST